MTPEQMATTRTGRVIAEMARRGILPDDWYEVAIAPNVGRAGAFSDGFDGVWSVAGEEPGTYRLPGWILDMARSEIAPE